MAMEINLMKVFIELWRLKWWIALASLVGAGVAFVFTVFFITPMYTSSVSMYVFNSATRESLVIASDIYTSDIYASQLLVNTYILVLQDDIVYEMASEQLLDEYGEEWISQYMPIYHVPDSTPLIKPNDLRAFVKMHSINSTELFQISVSTPNPELSARLCTIITELAPDILTRVVRVGAIEIINPAKPADQPSSPSKRSNTIIGFVGGGLLFSIVAAVIFLADNTVKERGEFIKRFNVRVLGEIPETGLSPKK